MKSRYRTIENRVLFSAKTQPKRFNVDDPYRSKPAINILVSTESWIVPNTSATIASLITPVRTWLKTMTHLRLKASSQLRGILKIWLCLLRGIKKNCWLSVSSVVIKCPFAQHRLQILMSLLLCEQVVMTCEAHWGDWMAIDQYLLCAHIWAAPNK